MSSVSYLVEHQENLLAVQIMLHGAGLSLKDDLRVETVKSTHTGSGDTEAIVLNTRDPTVSLLIDLPTPVASGQTSVLQQQDFHLETKLSALPTQSNGAIFSLNTVVQHPLSASDLRQAKPQALCCTACDREIADLTKANKSETAVEGSGFKDLPSEHWAEMLEVWMCHDDPAFTSQLAQRTTEGFWPTRENVLVGGSYILIHSEEAKTANLAVESINVSRSFYPNPLLTRMPSLHSFPPSRATKKVTVISPTGGRGLFSPFDKLQKTPINVKLSASFTGRVVVVSLRGVEGTHGGDCRKTSLRG